MYIWKFSKSGSGIQKSKGLNPDQPQEYFWIFPMNPEIHASFLFFPVIQIWDFPDHNAARTLSPGYTVQL